MQTKCWPRAQSRKTDSRGSLERGLPLGRAGRAGTDVWRKERKKGKKEYKKVGTKCTAWGLGHSPAGSGPVSLMLRSLSVCK